jgi:hypothetical protein
MVTDFSRLSEAMDEAAPPANAQLSTIIREKRNEIKNAIAEKGAAYISVGGRTYKISAASAK